MFQRTARRATPQPTLSDRPSAGRGRHHRAVREGEDRERRDAVARARRRTSQVGAWEAASGPIPTAAPARRSTPAVPGPPRIDTAAARRDPLTCPFAPVPTLPGARRAADTTMRAPVHAGVL
jgi:hypothetical protein